MTNKVLLVIGAHHDDCEYAACGLVLKAVSRGYRAVLVTLTGNHSSWAPTAGREDEVRSGLTAIARDMGVEKRFYDWGYHQVRYNDDGIRRLTELAVELKPRIALIHWPHDYWPDHEAAGKLSKHALWFPHGLHRDVKLDTRLYAFEAGANQTDPAVPFRPDVYIDISGEMQAVREVIRRIDGVVAGKTMTGPSCHEMDKDARSRLRGSECGVAYAEAFVALKRRPQDIL
ncbi:MAG: PIG-L family deacetylase [Planctomycetota bacterium]